MLLVNTEDAKERAAKVLYWATQAREPARWYQHTEIGYNYRMSNIVAGIGRGQLKVLDKRVGKKREIYQYYQDHLGDLPGISFMPMQDGARSNCWLTAIQLEEGCQVKPLDIMEALEKDDVESRPVWKPMHLQPVFSGCDFITQVEGVCLTEPVTGADSSIGGQIFQHGVCLPSDTKMKEEDLERICRVIRALWQPDAAKE